MPARRRIALVAALVALLAVYLAGVALRRSDAASTTESEPASARSSSFDAARPPAFAGARFLIVGGGGEPDSSELQLETDARALRAALGGPGVTLFAGGGGRHGVRVEAPGEASRGFRERLGELFLPRPRASTFRAPGFTVDGAATYENVTSVLAGALAERAQPLLVALVTHGDGAEDPRDAFATLWGNDGLFVRDVVDLLGARESVRPSRWLVGACHGGAFSVLADDAPVVDGAALHCGYFATSAERLSSGCDPNPERRNQPSYVGVVARVLASRRDVDGDGRVTLEDAHLEALRDLESFDVPERTSDRYLRDRADALAGDPAVLEELLAPLGAEAGASFEQRVVRPALASRLGVSGPIEGELDALRDELDDRAAGLEELLSMRDVAWNRLRVALLERHPWIEDAYAPGWESRVEALRAELEPLLLRSDLARALDETEHAADAAEAELDALRVREAMLTRIEDMDRRARVLRLLAAREPASLARHAALRACEAFAPVR